MTADELFEKIKNKKYMYKNDKSYCTFQPIKILPDKGYIDNGYIDNYFLVRLLDESALEEHDIWFFKDLLEPNINSLVEI